MIHDRIAPRDGERIDPDTCHDCFHLFEECCCNVPECSSEHTEPNTQQGQTTLFHAPVLADADVKGLRNAETQRAGSVGEARESKASKPLDAHIETQSGLSDVENSFDDRIADSCEWFDNLPKPPEPLPWLPQEKATDTHPFE